MRAVFYVPNQNFIIFYCPQANPNLNIFRARFIDVHLLPILQRVVLQISILKTDVKLHSLHYVPQVRQQVNLFIRD